VRGMTDSLIHFTQRRAPVCFQIGIKAEGLRFRQHLRTEMAHYG
jgi:glycyl-tRNA synthetase (class II)